MNKRLLIIVAFLVGVAALWAIGSKITLHETNGELPQIDNADTIYLDSLAEIAAAPDLMLNISKTQETILGNNVFVETSQQMLAYSGLGTENMRAELTETLTIDQHNVKITEQYSDGTGYITVNDGCFYASITAEDYQKRFAPAILMDASRYHSIVGYDTGDCYKIEFSKPQNAEQWVFENYTAIKNAKGTAYVSYDGYLLGSVYTLSYQRGQTRIRLTYNVDVEMLAANISLPENTEGYQQIAYLDGPRMLERATGYLMQADNVSAKYTDNVYCQAFGDRKEQEITLHTANVDGDWSALVETKNNLTNESKVGAESSLLKTELFIDGKYRSESSSADSVENPDVTEDIMRTYCKNLLIGTVMLPEDITGISIEETDSGIRLLFFPDETFAEKISASVCQTLYQKPELLNDISQGNTTNTLQGYLEFDTTTQLPIGSGIHYEGTFNINKTPYAVSFKADQIYDIISGSAEIEIKNAGA